ncbi:16S rRNA (guanine(1516)-N(2))-methyltransferase [hydrothermal vent metagenome]|uniref:16S rRNA (Guanine(1516)-N(2))-methyltransferase n=1 Tax=hydrothermal vent metagenome TaxID=652676 RepID=A0A3B0WM42_9ZZZZ
MKSDHKNSQYDLQLIFHDDLIELYDRQLNTTISIDFLSGTLAHRHQFGGGRGQAIAKAIGLKAGVIPNVLDTTAGLAGDAFVLATLGCPITMIERSPIIFPLIENAIERASLNEKFEPILEQGFTVINNDANDYIKQQLSTNAIAPDVIYIDPMYPHRKKSALVKKDMQILQRLHGADDNAAELLGNALLFAKKRVVVKRPIQADPIKAEALNDKKPNTCIKSKKTRYDIYTFEKM